MTISNNGTCNSLLYTYNNPQFFPIDGRGFGNYYNLSTTPHNFGFTFNFHGRFTYQGEEVFSFIGDDDVFVFINDMLALDLGGVHGSQAAEFDLSWPGSCPSTVASPPCALLNANASGSCACILGLTPGNSYAFDLFYNERHTQASDLKFTTSLLLQCPWYDWCDVCQGTYKNENNRFRMEISSEISIRNRLFSFLFVNIFRYWTNVLSLHEWRPLRLSFLPTIYWRVHVHQRQLSQQQFVPRRVLHRKWSLRRRMCTSSSQLQCFRSLSYSQLRSQ